MGMDRGSGFRCWSLVSVSRDEKSALKAKLDWLKKVEELHSKVLKLESAREPLPFTMMLRILGETRSSIPLPIGQYFGRRARTRRQ
jgi:hypothetical protein